MKIRNFIVKIYEKPFVYKIKAKDKKEAEQKATNSYYNDNKHIQRTPDIHKIKVVNNTDPEFYSTPLIDTQQEKEF
jgi:hypothetical protein